MNRALAARHAWSCTAFWLMVVRGAALGLVWGVLGPIGVIVVVAVGACIPAERRRLASPAASGIVTGFGGFLLWVATRVPDHRAAGWYVVGATLVAAGGAAFAAAQRR